VGYLRKAANRTNRVADILRRLDIKDKARGDFLESLRRLEERYTIKLES